MDTELKGWGPQAGPHSPAAAKGQQPEKGVRVMKALLRFVGEENGQDIMEYAVIVAFAVTAMAVLGILYTTIRDKLTQANTELQGVGP